MTETILLVGVDDISRQSISHCLDINYNIDVEKNCDDAYRYLLKNHLQTKLMFVGIDSLRSNEYEFLMRINRNTALGQIPVVCIGGESEDRKTHKEECREAIRHGAIDFAYPPYDEEILYYRVVNLIRMREKASVYHILHGDMKWKGYHVESSKGVSWKQSSLDALVMRTYVGAACILEYNENSISILRTNTRFFKELYGRELDIKQVMDLDLEKYLDPENCKILTDTLNLATKDNEEEVCSLILKDFMQIRQPIHMHVAVKMIDYVENRRLYYCTFRNDTQQYEAIHRERALMNQLQTIIKNVDVGVIASCMNHGEVSYIYENEFLSKMFGYTPEEFKQIPNRVFGLLVLESMERVRNVIMEEEKLENKQMKQIEMQARKKDGSIIWIRAKNSFCHLDSVDEPVFITMYEDITAERDAQDRIRMLNDRLSYSEIFILLDITNRRMEEYHSIYDVADPVDVIKAQDYEERVRSQIYEEDVEEAMNMFSYQKLMEHYEAGETKTSVEYRRKMDNGGYRWFCASAVLLEGAEPGVVNAFIYSHDMNDRMRMRIARNTVINADVSDVTITNFRTKTVLTMQMQTGATKSMGLDEYLKYEKIFIESVVAEEDRIRCRDFLTQENMLRALETKEYIDFSFWVIEQDGTNRRMNIHVCYLDNTKEDILFVGRDITALFEKEQQQQLALENIAELANQANQAKSDFLARMSHDMRTPLNSILGLTELAQKKENETNISEYIKSIDVSGRYLLGLINDTLDLSKIESGKMELHEEPYALDEFVMGINTVIRPLMDAKKIQFVMKLEEKVNLVCVDKLRFNQIFYNLLSNAAKYTPEGGRVEFISEEIPGKEDKRGMRFYIRDNGIGMSKDYQKVLFDPFSQETRSYQVEQKGTGLGLAIVKKIVDLSEGNIYVKSEIDKGSEFIVELYAKDITGDKVEQEKPKYDLSKLRGMRVLLVDDAEINVMIVTSLLEEKGCRVDSASNGQEAVNLFSASEEGYYDIIMTDVRMPVMDGLTETRTIRAMDRKDAKTIPIIGTTADAYTEAQDQTIAAGMNGRLVKPIETKLLYETFVRLTQDRQLGE